MPGLDRGKPAGVRCPHLTVELACALWEKPERPAICGRLRPSAEMCGRSQEEALAYLAELEERTRPDDASGR
jgi:hypothetical protein